MCERKEFEYAGPFPYVGLYWTIKPNQFRTDILCYYRCCHDSLVTNKEDEYINPKPELNKMNMICME